MLKRDVGRLITKALRHRPQMLNLHLDKAGYCNVDELIKGLNLYGYEADKNLIEEIGKNERFSFNEKHTKIRVDYGNSIGLKLSDMYETNDIPPEVLYHGTYYDAIESIKRNGIVRFAKIGKARNHIFLTERKDVALKKGNRYGKEIALPINAIQLHNDGFKFYHAKNDIWLISDTIPSNYIGFSNLIYE